MLSVARTPRGPCARGTTSRLRNAATTRTAPRPPLSDRQMFRSPPSTDSGCARRPSQELSSSFALLQLPAGPRKTAGARENDTADTADTARKRLLMAAPLSHPADRRPHKNLSAVIDAAQWPLRGGGLWLGGRAGNGRPPVLQ
jgi:hypothetical protein